MRRTLSFLVAIGLLAIMAGSALAGPTGSITPPGPMMQSTGQVAR
jgi:hypothetical protein